MKRYLHLYSTEQAFEADYEGAAYEEPWVSLTLDVDRVDYNKGPVPPDPSNEPLTFEILSNGNITLNLNNTYSPATLEYSKNGGEWVEISGNGNNISVEEGDEIKFRGNNQYGVGSYSSIFSGTSSQFNVRGNIMSVVSKENFASMDEVPTTPGYGAFQRIFGNNSGSGAPVVSAENLVLPSIVKGSCYNAMFQNCASLVKPPRLSATSLTGTSYVYGYMFDGCVSLVEAPELPSTELGASSYAYMFRGCINLKHSPSLPATALTENCYLNMFYGCTSLETAPELLAAYIPLNGYNGMFTNCAKISYIKCLATSMEPTAVGSWLYGVSSTGTFVKAASMNDWESGDSGIPSGWTVQDA